MNAQRIHTCSGIDPTQLGVDDSADLFRPERWVGGNRLEWSPESGGRRVGRLPLPGTPAEDGRFREPPRGAGTGWLRIYHFGPARARAWGARLSAPRSSSLAARAWNLFCYLGTCGVGTPEPLGFWERGAGLFASESLLVLREPERWRPLSELAALAGELTAERRRAVVAGVDAALHRLEHSGCLLPELEPAQVWVSSDESEGEDCAAHAIGALQNEARERSALPDLPRRELAGVLVNDVRGGRLLARPAPGRWAPVLAGVRASLEALA